MEIVFGGLIALAFASMMRMTRGAYFSFDDWPLILQAGSGWGMFEPYNDHLVLAVLAVYRPLIELFGFEFTPFRIFGLMSLLGVPVAFFSTTRRHLGPPLAAIAALTLLAFDELELDPPASALYLSLIGGVLCAAALNRGPRSDWVLAASLVLSLSASSAGVAVAGACVVHNLARRASRRRWAVVLGPCLAWAVWWLVEARTQESPRFRPAVRPSLADAAAHAAEIAWSPFSHLSLGYTAVGLLLAALFVSYGVWRLSQGLEPASNILAWTAALTVWAFGIAFARDLGAGTEATDDLPFRYQVLTLGFALLALVPRRPIRWPDRIPVNADARWRVASAGLVLVLGLVMGLAARDDIARRADVIEARGQRVIAELLLLDAGPDVDPNHVTMSPAFLTLPPHEVKALLDRYGGAPQADPGGVDQQLVDLVVRPSTEADLGRPCGDGTDDTFAPGGTTVLFWSSTSTASVEVRRFGATWIELATGSAARSGEVTLPRLGSDVPWEIRVRGGCIEALVAP